MSKGRGGGAAKLRRRSGRAAAGKTISIDKSNFGHRSLSDLGQRICDVPSDPMRRQTQLDGAGWTSTRNGFHAILGCFESISTNNTEEIAAMSATYGATGS